MNLILTEKIHIKTYFNEPGKWIQFRRGPIFKELVNLNAEPEIDEDGFQKVNSKNKKNEKNTLIYYWYVHAHNLYPFDKKNLNLYFCNPDAQIIQNDSNPQFAINLENPEEMIPLIFYAKWNGIKFKPITFIAKSSEQIVGALNHISYCVVQENEYGKLVATRRNLRRASQEESKIPQLAGAFAPLRSPLNP